MAYVLLKRWQFIEGHTNMEHNIWQKVCTLEGEVFYTKTGVPFTYHIRNNYICLENTNRVIPRKQVEEAADIKSDVVTSYSKYQGYPYLYGILHDARIQQGQTT